MPGYGLLGDSRSDSVGGMGRRRFLGIAGAAAVAGWALPAEAMGLAARPRALAFDNLHTGERLKTVYWERGRYLPEAMRQIDWLLRDFRADETHAIDHRLLDLLTALHARLETHEPFAVISGYRSPATNAMLAATTDGVAQNSFHLKGMAIDVRVPGRQLGHLRAAALSLKRGGVGYYPHSDFIHVDTGPIRHWTLG
jgi:uncharacterized protein YcbK (DUF882 family)